MRGEVQRFGQEKHPVVIWKPDCGLALFLSYFGRKAETLQCLRVFLLAVPGAGGGPGDPPGVRQVAAAAEAVQHAGARQGAGQSLTNSLHTKAPSIPDTTRGEAIREAKSLENNSPVHIAHAKQCTLGTWLQCE